MPNNSPTKHFIRVISSTGEAINIPVDVLGDGVVVARNLGLDTIQYSNLGSNEQLLASIAGVNMNTATPTPLYTVPAGKSFIPTRVVVRKASISLDTASYSFGFNDPTDNDVIADATHTELTGPTLFSTLIAKAGAAVGNAGDVFAVVMNVLQGAAATTTIDVYGLLV